VNEFELSVISAILHPGLSHRVIEYILLEYQLSVL